MFLRNEWKDKIQTGQESWQEAESNTTGPGEVSNKDWLQQSLCVLHISKLKAMEAR